MWYFAAIFDPRPHSRHPHHLPPPPPPPPPPQVVNEEISIEEDDWFEEFDTCPRDPVEREQLWQAEWEDDDTDQVRIEIREASCSFRSVRPRFLSRLGLGSGWFSLARHVTCMLTPRPPCRISSGI